MKAEAKANEATDKEARDKVEKINAADGLIFQTEKQLKPLNLMGNHVLVINW